MAFAARRRLLVNGPLRFGRDDKMGGRFPGEGVGGPFPVTIKMQGIAGFLGIWLDMG